MDEMNARPVSVAIGLIALVFLAGCQTARPLYYWGHYEPMLYQSYKAPQKAPPERQIEWLLEDEQKAAAANLPVHPGFHSQLGYLYYQTGKFDLAQKEFEAEKRLFPESAVFMDRMLQHPPAATPPAVPAPAEPAAPAAAPTSSTAPKS